MNDDVRNYSKCKATFYEVLDDALKESKPAVTWHNDHAFKRRVIQKWVSEEIIKVPGAHLNPPDYHALYAFKHTLANIDLVEIAKAFGHGVPDGFLYALWDLRYPKVWPREPLKPVKGDQGERYRLALAGLSPGSMKLLKALEGTHIVKVPHRGPLPDWMGQMYYYSFAPVTRHNMPKDYLEFLFSVTFVEAKEFNHVARFGDHLAVVSDVLSRQDDVYAKETPDDPLSINHLLHMQQVLRRTYNEAQDDLSQGKGIDAVARIGTKEHRWLGFLHAGLVAQRLTTLKELKDRLRAIEKPNVE